MGAVACAKHAQRGSPGQRLVAGVFIGGNGAGRETIAVHASVAARIEQRVVYEGVVHKVPGFVVGNAVLVKEHEGVDLAQREAGLARAASAAKRHVELVPGLRKGELGVVWVAAGKRGAVDRAGVGRAQRQAFALAEAGMHKQLARAAAKIATGQGHCHIAPVIGTAAATGRVVQVTAPGLLHHAGQAAFDAGAVQRFDQRAGGRLQRLLLCFHGLQARGQFGFVCADAVAVEGAAQLGVLGFQALHALGQRLDLYQQCLGVGGCVGSQRCGAGAQDGRPCQGCASENRPPHVQ